MTKHSRHIRFTILHACLAAAFGSALAAESAKEGGEAGKRSVDEGAPQVVTVTALRRKEKMQDVPLAVSALTEGVIEKSGIDKVDDYVSRLPGVRFSREASQSSFSIRGIATGIGAGVAASPVGVYVDDYPMYDSWARSASPDQRVFDVERIELLRGPQGTLFGATTLSGALRIITNKPNLKQFEAKAEASVASIDGGGNDRSLSAMINQPLSASAALRLVVYDRNDAGWVDNPVRGVSDANSGRTSGGRIALKLQPSPQLSILATLSQQKTAQKDSQLSYYSPPAGKSEDEWKSVLPTGLTDGKLNVGSLVADYDMGWASLNVTAIHGRDTSEYYADNTPISALFGANVPTLALTFGNDSRSDTLEARLTSRDDGRFRYLLGAYYNKRQRDFRQNVLQDALVPRVGTNRIYLTSGANETTETAVFGEGTWRLDKQWSVTAGARVFSDEYHFVSNISGLLNLPTAPLKEFLTDARNKASAITPRFSLVYQPSAQTTTYATAARGYRFGLTNYYVGTQTNIPLQYRSDRLWNYELGLKHSGMGGRLVSNSALYYIDWSDIQMAFRNSSGQGYTANAGNARSYGVESEISFRPNATWELYGAFAFGVAELTEGNPGVMRRAASARGPAVWGTLKGDRLPGSPKGTAAAGMQLNVGSVLDGTGYVRIDQVYVGPSYVDFMKEGSLKIGDYGQTNIRFGYLRYPYEVIVFIHNALNSRGVTAAVPNADVLYLTDGAYRIKPAAVGVTWRAQF